MPTIEITSDPLTPSRRLKIATKVTQWLVDQGANREHVVVRFIATEPMSYFAGGLPLTRYDEVGDTPYTTATWANVVCRVHPDRDTAFRSELMATLKSSLGADNHLVVRFCDTTPNEMRYSGR